jgi:hypothetical protein
MFVFEQIMPLAFLRSGDLIREVPATTPSLVLAEGDVRSQGSVQ